MQRRPDRFNTKRKIQSFSERGISGALIENVKYGGNPEHKKNPGDFGLTPPSSPRPAKSLCDTVEIFSKKVAIAHLKDGLRKGMVSHQASIIIPPGARPGSAGVPPARGPEARAPRKLVGVMIKASHQMQGKWPQNIWAVTSDGIPLEAQLENLEIGVYHGYPMPESDPFSNQVIKEWHARDGKD